jgi:hypothetical protein
MTAIAENVKFAPLFTKLISANISHRVLGLSKKDYEDYSEKKSTSIRQTFRKVPAKS